jgi:hypothetical protein
MKKLRGIFGLTLGVLGLAIAGEASAGCMMNAPQQNSPAKSADSSAFVPAVYHPDGSAGSFIKTNWDGDFDEGVVGLWQFTFTGFSPDWGTMALHSDGTEITFSGGQNPETGDVCQGVWRKVGKDTYTLNHIAMGWFAPGAAFGIRVHLHFIFKLNASGTAFNGTYTATVFCENGAPIPGATCTTPSPFFEFDSSKSPSATNPNNVVASGTGSVTAVRVVPD